MIASVILESLPKIRALCKRQGVQRMSIFGSATRKNFSPERSDIDCLVKFFDTDKPGFANRYFNLAEELERILQRPVDLITERSIRNPIFREAVERSKILIYHLIDVQMATENIAEFLKEKTRTDYLNDLLLRSAVERQFEIIGEALNRASREKEDLELEILDLWKIIGLQNLFTVMILWMMKLYGIFLKRSCLCSKNV